MIMDIIISIAAACVPALAAWIARVVVPWIKARTTAEQQKTVLAMVKIAVDAAEQLGNSGVIEDGKGKKEFVRRRLRNQGIDLPEETLDTYIEASVLELRARQDWGLTGAELAETVTEPREADAEAGSQE